MERLHVAVFPWMGSGHVNPILELSRRLIQLGFTVTFVHFEGTNLSSIRPNEEHINLISIPKHENFTLISCAAAQDSVENALKALQNPVKCIISDWFFDWTQDVANALGIPRAILVPSSARTEVIAYHVPRLVSEGFLPVNKNPEDNTLITFLPGFEPIHRRQLPLSLYYVEGPLIKFCEEMLGRAKEAACILLNTVEELEQEIIDARRKEFKYLPVGPLLPSEMLSDEEETKSRVGLRESDLSVLNWLDKYEQHKVLYVAFGSVHSLAVAQIEKIAQALEVTGHPFLWAIRRNFAKDANEDFFKELVKRFTGQGLVVEWAPQVHVLRHKSVGAFLTHCGWNSTMESVCAGVPTICWPLGAEQNMNAANMVDKWKIGKKVAERTETVVTAEEIRETIRTVMDQSGEGGELRCRTKELMHIVKSALQGGSSEKNLLRFKDIASSF